MSFDALAWAAKCKPGSMADKMVLLALAESAGRESGLAFPSVAAICEFGNMDRKTVLASLARLHDAGFIRDTGKRMGRTSQVKVFELALGKSPENGTVKESRKRDTIPKTGPFEKPVKKQASARKGPKNGTVKGSQKRDTEPVYPTDIDNIRARVPKPDGVDDQTWRDFLKHRKKIGGDLTPTAMKGFVREAEKAGWSLEDALTETIFRGWRGFKAEWVQDKKTASDESYLKHLMRTDQ